MIRKKMLKYKKSFIQFIKFVFVGISNTVISYVAYFILIKIGLHYIVASVVGFLMSVLNSFYWNNKYVFHSYCHDTRSIGKGLVKTFIAYAGSGLVLSNLLLIFWVEILNISELIAPIINLLITVPLNFLLNKFWTFNGNSAGLSVKNNDKPKDKVE